MGQPGPLRRHGHQSGGHADPGAPADTGRLWRIRAWRRRAGGRRSHPRPGRRHLPGATRGPDAGKHPQQLYRQSDRHGARRCHAGSAVRAAGTRLRHARHGALSADIAARLPGRPRGLSNFGAAEPAHGVRSPRPRRRGHGPGQCRGRRCVGPARLRRHELCLGRRGLHARQRSALSGVPAGPVHLPADAACLAQCHRVRRCPI